MGRSAEKDITLEVGGAAPRKGEMVAAVGTMPQRDRASDAKAADQLIP